MIVRFSPTAELLAIDTTVKNKWERSETGISELLDLPRDGGTDLPKALSEHDLENSVVLTDDDGWKQLSNIDDRPCLVIEVGSEKEINRTISLPEIWHGKETTIEINVDIGSEKTLYFHFRE